MRSLGGSWRAPTISRRRERAGRRERSGASSARGSAGAAARRCARRGTSRTMVASVSPGRPGAERRCAPVARGMTGVDWIIVGFVALLALFGWAQGFVVGRARAGRASRRGAFAGTRLGPLLLPDGRALARTRRCSALVGALLRRRGPRGRLRGLGAAALRTRLSRRRRSAPSTALLGAVLSAVRRARASPGSLGAVALQTPGPASCAATSSARRSCARSTTRCRRRAPLLNALARFDPFPRIDGPEADVRAAAAAHRPRPARCARPRRSVVKVLGTACGLGVEGSGWVARAGRRRHQRARRRGRERHARAAARHGAAARRARAVAFDPRNDIAVLRVAGAAARRRCALARDPAPGTSARDPRLPAQRPLRRARRRGSARRADGHHPGRLRPRAGPAPDHVAARRWCARATPAARWSTAAAAS